MDLDVTTESGRNLVMSMHQIQPECRTNEQDDAGRDGRTRLARPNY